MWLLIGLGYLDLAGRVSVQSPNVFITGPVDVLANGIRPSTATLLTIFFFKRSFDNDGFCYILLIWRHFQNGWRNPAKSRGTWSANMDHARYASTPITHKATIDISGDLPPGPVGLVCNIAHTTFSW